MELQVGVKVLLKNKDGKYLLVKRNAKKYPEVGPRWDIVCGRIEPGSSLIENLKREIKEETNLELTEEPKLIAAQDILRVHEKHVVRLTYVGNSTGEVNLHDEHTESKWFTIDEIKNLENLDIYFKELLDKNFFTNSSISSMKAFIEDNGKILLLKKHMYGNVRWDIPGGKVVSTESPIDALIREITEETGLSVKIIKPLGVWSFHSTKIGNQIVCTTFLCKPLDNEVDISKNPEEGYNVTGFEWVSKEEIINGNYPVNENLRKFIEEHLESELKPKYREKLGRIVKSRHLSRKESENENIYRK